MYTAQYFYSLSDHRHCKVKDSARQSLWCLTKKGLQCFLLVLLIFGWLPHRCSFPELGPVADILGLIVSRLHD